MKQAVDQVLERFGKADPTARQRHGVFAIESLRIEILRHLLGDVSYRNFAKTLCMSDLLAQFCGLHRMDGIRVRIEEPVGAAFQAVHR